MPFFSIILPCYNSEKTLSKCLDSIVNQSFGDFECIVCDDGSNDRTDTILALYQKKDKRIACIRQDNKGTCEATNSCIRKAKGQYIVPIDHDDWIDYSLLEEIKKVIDASDSDLIGFFSDSFPKDDSALIDKRCEDGRLIVSTNTKEKYDIAFNKSHIFRTHTSTSFRKELLENIVFRGNPVGADTVVMNLLIHRANKVAVINKVLYHRFNDKNSQSRIKRVDGDNWLFIIYGILLNIKLYKDNKKENRCLNMGYNYYLMARSEYRSKNSFLLFKLYKVSFRLLLYSKLFIRNKIISNYIVLLFPFFPIRSSFLIQNLED